MLFELVAVLHVVATTLVLRANGLRLGWDAVVYTCPELMKGTLLGMGYGLVIYLGWQLAHRRPWRYVLRQVMKPAWLLMTLRIWLSIVIGTFAYMWLKVSIPLINERLWDGAIWELDAMLHLGVAPAIFLTSLFEGTGLLPLVDFWYHIWVWTSMLGLMFFCCFRQPGFRRRLVLAHVLMWVAAVWCYLAVPTLGPVYVDQSGWASVREEIPRASASQYALWTNYEKVLEGRTGPLRQLNPTRGIAAMPSLHVGAYWMLMLWARQRARKLFVWFALGTVVTFIGSLVTGWHYAVDGYVGILVAQLSYHAAMYVSPRLKAVSRRMT